MVLLAQSPSVSLYTFDNTLPSSVYPKTCSSPSLLLEAFGGPANLNPKSLKPSLGVQLDPSKVLYRTEPSTPQAKRKILTSLKLTDTTSGSPWISVEPLMDVHAVPALEVAERSIFQRPASPPRTNTEMWSVPQETAAGREA